MGNPTDALGRAIGGDQMLWEMVGSRWDPPTTHGTTPSTLSRWVSKVLCTILPTILPHIRGGWGDGQPTDALGRAIGGDQMLCEMVGRRWYPPQTP